MGLLFYGEQMKIIKLASLHRQVGGEHYKNRQYELAQFSLDVGLNPMIHSAIKYVLREKNDRAEDLNKAQHCAEIFRDWVTTCATTAPKRLANFNTTMDFDLVATFLSQYEAHEQAAILALIHLQVSVKLIEEVLSDFSISRHIDVNEVTNACIQALEHIERLK